MFLLGHKIWKALKAADLSRIVELYNIVLAYDDYAKNRNEYWYRSMFMMLLFKNLIVMLEFKFAKKSSDVERLKAEDITQVQDREYTKGYELDGRRIISAVLVANDERKHVTVHLLNIR